MILISHYQASEILEALTKGRKEVASSLDLGKSRAIISLEHGKAIVDVVELSEKELKEVIKHDTSCFMLKEGKLAKVQLFSEDTNNFYKLFPTGKDTPPTVEISGIRMHNVKGTNPWKDAQDKLRLIRPVRGHVLDTCMGLGYTAINAAKTSDVETFERDPNIVTVASYNPWSAELFNNPRIHINQGNVAEIILKLAANSFDRVIHDPPRFSLSGELYSEDFYKQLYRVMKPRAKLFHYTGAPGRKGGKDLVGGIIKRLQNAGFRNVKRRYNGLIAIK